MKDTTVCNHERSNTFEFYKNMDPREKVANQGVTKNDYFNYSAFLYLTSSSIDFPAKSLK